MDGFTDLRLQAANDQIRRMHAEAANRRLASRAPAQSAETTSSLSIGSVFGRSLRALGLAH